MASKIHILESGGPLKKRAATVRRIVRQSLAVIRSTIPVRDVDIVVGHNPYYAIPHLGIGGYTPHANLVLVWVDMDHKAIRKNLQVQMLRTLAHELHHAARWDATGYGRTLREALVSEGLADHFELEVAGGKPEAWDRTLSRSSRLRWLRTARRQFNRAEYNHDEWFFGSRRGGPPRWTGYSLGFYLVGEYLKQHLMAKPSTLFKTPARTIAP